MIYSSEDINWVFDRMNGRCFYCGMRLERNNYGSIDGSGAWDVSHFVPLSPDVAHERDNWVPACIVCETVKRDVYPWEFDARRFNRGDACPGHYLTTIPFVRQG